MTKERLPILQEPALAVKRQDFHRRDFALLVFGWVGTLGSMIAASAAALRGLVPNLLDEPNLRYRAAKPTDYLDGRRGPYLHSAQRQRLPSNVGRLHPLGLHRQSRPQSRPRLPLPVSRQCL